MAAGEDGVYITLLQRAAHIAGTTLLDPDSANRFAFPLFDDGTPRGRRLPVGRARIDDEILCYPENSATRESSVRALGHFLKERLRTSE